MGGPEPADSTPKMSVSDNVLSECREEEEQLVKLEAESDGIVVRRRR